MRAKYPGVPGAESIINRITNDVKDDLKKYYAYAVRWLTEREAGQMFHETFERVQLIERGLLPAPQVAA